MFPPQRQPQSPQPQQPGPAAAPAGAPNPAQPPGGGLPPAATQHVDPRNPLQQALVRRLSAFTPQDADTLRQGVTPAAFAVLKKLLPEIGFVFDQLSGGAGAGGAGAPGGDGGDAGGAEPPAPGAGARMQPPANSRFNQMT